MRIMALLCKEQRLRSACSAISRTAACGGAWSCAS